MWILKCLKALKPKHATPFVVVARSAIKKEVRILRDFPSA